MSFATRLCTPNSLRSLSRSGLPIVAATLARLPSIAHADTAPAVPTTPATTAEQKSLLLQMLDAFQKIAEAVEPSVVNIKTSRVRNLDGADDTPEIPQAPDPKGNGDKDKTPPV